MLRDITLGQYYPADSVIHKLDPRTKLFATLLFIISVFSFQGIVGFAVITIFLFVVIALSKVPLSFMLRGLKAIVILLLIAGLFNLFLTPGQTLWSIWKIRITREGLRNAVLMTVRMVYLIMGSSVMMMSIALRFIPILIEETDKIMKAQMARGADFESGGLIKKAKNMVPLLVPLFVSAFRRANDLALAMEARCYVGGDGRTKMMPLVYDKVDRVAYVIVIAYFVLLMIIKAVL